AKGYRFDSCRGYSPTSQISGKSAKRPCNSEFGKPLSEEEGREQGPCDPTYLRRGRHCARSKRLSSRCLRSCWCRRKAAVTLGVLSVWRAVDVTFRRIKRILQPQCCPNSAASCGCRGWTLSGFRTLSSSGHRRFTQSLRLFVPIAVILPPSSRA